MNVCSNAEKEKISKRIEIIRRRALENNIMKSKIERL